MKLAALSLLSAAILMGQTPAPQEPSHVASMGFGASGLGPVQPFGYFTVCEHIATQTYTCQTSEFVRMAGGKVGTSALAGISKILWAPGPLRIGLIGEAGAAEGATGSASGSVQGTGFLGVQFGKSAWGLLMTARTIKIAGTGEQGKYTLGVSYSW